MSTAQIKGGSQARLVLPLDIEFERIPMPALSSRCTPYTRWLRSGMPHLGPYALVLRTVCFLYPDETSAKAGVQAGGTGFLVGVPMKNVPGYLHIHVVTNYHVAVFNKFGPPSPVIRINCKDGKSDAFDFDPSQWVFKPGGCDVAISPPLELVDQIHDYRMLTVAEWFLSKEEEITKEVGPGDDVFMIGRFVDFDGVETNSPAARFGHISMMDARIEQSTGYNGRSIVLDMHSRSGFSGSPVFVYRTLGSHFLPDPEPGQHLRFTGGGHYINLLGIHYAQFPEQWEIRDKKPVSYVLGQATVEANKHYIEGLSGMTCVVPASEIADLITKSPELIKMRDEREKRFASKVGSSAGPKPESSSSPQANDENPTHREDFTRLVGAAARKPAPKD
jgi:hypothetical protein